MKKFVGNHFRYPDLTGKRQAEGGMRLRGKVRESRPGLPLVTIITVCFNSSKTIEQTFRSVRNQTYTNIEYVVVDGASTDDTLDIIKDHKDLIDYYVSEPDDGLYFAMNKGLELARGDYILVLNSDDWYTQDAVQSLVTAQSYSGCDFVGALAKYLDDKQGREIVLRSMPFDDSVYFRMSLRHETMLVPAWLYDRAGFYDTKYSIISDRDLTARFFDLGVTYYEIPRALLYFRTSGISNTDSSRLNDEKGKLLAKEFPFLSNAELATLNDLEKNTPEHYAEIANAHLDQEKFVKACRALLADRRAHGGKRWQSDAVECIGTSDLTSWPKVSVILPFYEASETIARCLDSVLAQTLESLEIICVNDCAIDDSQLIVDKYIVYDPRVKCIRNSVNVGLGASRNIGIRAARGRYIFHVDPDDTLPPNALESIHALAERYGSDMTRGAYIHEQLLLGQSKARKERKGLKEGAVHIVNTTLAHSPDLLMNTEGHWSYLYRAEFAKSVNYPEDLKMGQDSIFIVNAVAQAQSISVTDALVYHYRANPNSAMNTFNFRKFMDALEWRIRAWSVLDNAGFREAGEHLLFRFWSPAFFQNLTETLSDEEKQAFDQKLGRALRSAGYPGSCPSKLPQVRQYFETVLQALALEATSDVKKPLRIATFSTMDHGGAGLGSHRRVEALRRHGVDARIHCLIKKTNMSYVHQITLSEPLEGMDLRVAWRKAAVLTRQEHPGLKARELFSKIDSVVDFRKLKHVFDRADVVHLHWVPGIVDYANMDELADKAVVWTLADMNAFTGGCHYSEGCEGYKDKCLNCPLLNEASDLPHKAWKVKRDAYEKIPNLHVVCPSEWLAECARNSSLLGGRPIHVIPNALPVDRFTLVNRFVARRKLGLPFDKKFILFGADNLTNKRKGGDILIESIKQLISKGFSGRTEALFFGSGSLDLGIPSHSMGSVSDELKMSLIYAAADVFAFPSREDNAPLTVAESMLSGTPVVAFPVGNVNELVIHMQNGYIASYGNPVDFAKGLEWALSDTGSSQALLRGLRAHRSARVHNDPSTSAQRHIALYSKMLNAPKR